MRSNPTPPQTPPSRNRLRNTQLMSPPAPRRVTKSISEIAKAEHHESQDQAHSFQAALCRYHPCPSFSPSYEIVGCPSLQIYKLRIPSSMMKALPQIILLSESYASTLPRYWRTDLYSLTKQDLALQDIPGMSKLVKPISLYIKKCICTLYGCRAIEVDRNQPHILKYSMDSGHTGGKLRDRE